MDHPLTRTPSSKRKCAVRGIFFLLLFGCFSAVPLEALQRNRKEVIPDFYRQFVRRENVGTSVRGELRNGLRVVVEEYSPRPVSALNVVVGTGYADEDSTSEGAASALAWWIRFSSGLAEKLALEGGQFESTALARQTVFSVALPAANLLPALEILAELLDPSLLNGISLDTIRTPAATGRGHEEWLTFSGADRRLWELVHPAQGSRVAALEIAGVPVAGPDLTTEALIRFHRNHYQPSNLTIVVSGGVVREKILARVAELHAGRGNPGSQPVAPAKMPTAHAFQYELRREVGVPVQSLFGYSIPGREHVDLPALQLIQAALAGSRGLLSYTLVQKGLASRAEVSLWPSGQGGLLRISLFPDPEKIDQAEVQLFALLRLIAEKGLHPHDLNRAKARLIGDYWARLRSPRQRAQILFAQCGEKNWSDLSAWPRLIAGLTDKDVRRVVSSYLSQENLSLLESFPPTGPIREFTARTLAETLELLVPGTMAELERDTQTRWEGPASPFQPSALPKRQQGSRLKRASVLRGPHIFIEEEHSAPLVDMGVFFPGGRVQETRANQGITELVLRSLEAATAEGANWRPWESLEERGARLELVNEPDFFGFRLQFHSSDLQDILAEFMTWLRAGGFDAAQVASARQALGVFRAMEQQDLFAAGRLAIRSKLFPEHGYGWSRYGSSESVAGLDLDAVRSWYADLMQNVHPLIVLYGDVEGTAFLPDLIPLLSSSKLRYRSREAHPPSPDAGDPSLLRLGKSWIFGGVPGPAQGTRADWTLDVLGSLLRLKRFEPDKPGQEKLPTHIKSQRDAFFEGGILFFGRPIPSSQTDERDFFRQLAGLSQTRVTEQDVRHSIVLSITDYYLQRSTGSEYVLDLGRHLLAGEKPDYQEEYLTTIRSLTVDDLRLAAGRFLGQLARFTVPVDNPEQP